MKNRHIAIVVALLLLLAIPGSVALAEAAPTEKPAEAAREAEPDPNAEPVDNVGTFLSGLSQAWGGLLGMASDAGQAVSDWADESGVTQWAEDSGVTQWAEDTTKNIAAWADESGVTEWTEGAAAGIQTFIDEKGPGIAEGLGQAGEGIQQAWNALVGAGSHD